MMVSWAFAMTAFVGMSAWAAAAKSIVPAYDLIKTKNGAEVYYFKSERIPLFQVELVFEGGSASDPEGKSGLAFLAATLARRGVPGLDENALSRKIDDLAAGISLEADADEVSMSAYGLNEHAAEVVKLMFAQLSAPTFPERVFSRVRANHVEALARLSDSAAALASRAESLVVFNGTPYARSSAGVLDDVSKISLGEIKTAFPTLTCADRVKALVIGGRSRAEILEPVLKGLEALPRRSCDASRPSLRPIRSAKWNVPRDAVLVIDRPGISEAHVRMGFVGPPRETSDYHELVVAETVLGGHFGSRLNEVIRERLNLSYAIGADFRFGRRAGMFSVSGSAKTAKVDDLIAEIREQLRAFASNGPTAHELEVAKEYLIGAFPLGLQNAYAIATAFFDGKVNGLPSSFLDDFPAAIAAVDHDRIMTALRRHFKVGEMTTIVVGDAKAIIRELKKRGLPFVSRDAKDFL